MQGAVIVNISDLRLEIPQLLLVWGLVIMDRNPTRLYCMRTEIKMGAGSHLLKGTVTKM